MFNVIEMQNGVIGANTWVFDNQIDAEAKYHSILAVAAKSSVEVHAACIIADTGAMIRSEVYYHPVQE